MKMKNWISAVAALALACSAGADWRGEMPEELVALRPNERTASVYHSYEFEPIADTPPPDGFKPFYISHYGRHGSRYLTGSAVPDVMSALEKANKRNALTETGRSLLADMRKIAAVHDDMKGQLAERGAWELQRLARRMAGRFPEVFSRRRRVHCRSSVSPRVLISQANFTMALKDAAPQLEFDFATGERHHKVINPLHWARMDKPDIATRSEKIAESFAKDGIDPGLIQSRLSSVSSRRATRPRSRSSSRRRCLNARQSASAAAASWADSTSTVTWRRARSRPFRAPCRHGTTW